MIYGNYKVLDRNGELLFKCGHDKFAWYLRKGLAVLVPSENELDSDTIQLRFQHKGCGCKSDAFLLGEKDNKCVVCGTTDKLTRHHVIPHWYRKFFPAEYKEHQSHDVVPACEPCHMKYETEFAWGLKKELAIQYNAPFSSDDMEQARVLKTWANALHHYHEKIPQKRKDDLTINIALAIGRFPNEDDIADMACTDIEYDYSHGKKVVDQLTNFQEFAEMWRKHFVDSMNPQHLPLYWSVTRSLELE